MTPNGYHHRKEKDSSLYQQAKVQYSILANQRWFRVMVPFTVATAWLFWGVQQQRRVVQLKKVQAQFPKPSIDNNITHWCYLSREKGVGAWDASSIHMPYAIEWLTGCWAWLEGHNQTSAVIALDRNSYEKVLVEPHFPAWNRDFFQSLQFPVLLEQETPLERPVFFHKAVGKEAWFGNDHSCYTFRERLWKALEIQPPRAIDPSQIHIGLVEQPIQRFTIDADQLVHDLQQQLPNTTIAYRILEEGAALVDQASWFAQQDIIIVAHGAVTKNLIFMRPDTQFLELFPTNFFTEIYQTLAQQCGIHHDWYYDGGPNPQQDMNDHFDQRGWRRKENIHITLDQLKSHVEQMVVNLKQY